MKYFLSAKNDYPRLDNYLVDEIKSESRSRIQLLITEGYIKVNNKIVCTKSKPIFKNDEIEVLIPPLVPVDIAPKIIPLEIVFEDDHLLVINKEKGLTVHPSISNQNETLVNAILAIKDIKLSGINGVLRPGIVHRIDKNTSGLIVVAKDDETHKGLAAQFFDHSIKREYLGIVHGILSEDKKTIETNIARSKNNRKKFAVCGNNEGKKAITNYQVLDVNDIGEQVFSLVKFNLLTGRTHQIRVHMSYLKHPLAGDNVYTRLKNPFNINGQILFARKLGFIHPITNKEMVFTSKPPKDFYRFFPELDSFFINENNS